MRLYRALIGLSLLSALGLGCAPSPPPSPAPEAAVPSGPSGSVVIYSGRDAMFVEPLLALVQETLPGIEVVIDYGKDPLYLDRLRAERSAPRADLFLTKGSGAAESAAADGLLAPLPEELLGRVPERFRGGGERWVALSARARVLVVRKGVDPPTSILDLAAPPWAGRVARTVATNSSFVGGVASTIADMGAETAEAWLRGLDANSADGGVFPKHTPAVAAVAEGARDVALVNHYYFYRSVFGSTQDAAITGEEAAARLAAAPIQLAYPDADGTGVMWNVTGGGIVAGGPHPDAARAVLDLLLSDAGQRAYAWSNREYPVVDGVPAPPGVAAPDSFAWSRTTLPQLAAQSEAAAALIQTVGLQ